MYILIYVGCFDKIALNFLLYWDNHYRLTNVLNTQPFITFRNPIRPTVYISYEYFIRFDSALQIWARI